MKYYLGIDGGGTKTKFTLCTKDLKIVGEYKSSPCHYLQIGYDGLENMIRNGVSEVCKIARISDENIAHAFIGCAGYEDIAADTPKINASLAKAMGTTPFSVGNDCDNALAGALGGKPGINIIAGTGSIGSGRDESGNHKRCGGWHHAIGGDEGSGYWIAWRLIHEYQRQSDGRDEKTALYDAINEALDLKSDDELVTRVVEEWQMDRKKIAALSPICSKLYEAGDPYAAEILKDCAHELADHAIALKSQLDFKGDIPVSGTGGIFKIGPAVTDEFNRILKEHGMYYVAPLYDPDMGSVLLAILEEKH